MPDARDNHPLVYRDGDLVVYRASGIGACLAALQFARAGMKPEEPPASMRRRFDDSVLHERGIVLHAMETLDLEEARAEDRKVAILPITRRVIVRGATDGRAADGTIIEAKALSEGGYLDWINRGWEGFDRYAWQTSAYMFGAREDGWGGRLVMAVKCVSRESKHYGEVHITTHEEPPYSRDDIAARVLEVEARYAQEADPECSQRDFPCPYWWIGEACGGAVDEVEEVRDEAFEKWAAGHFELRQQAKALERALARSRERGSEFVGQPGTVAVGSWEVRRSDYDRSYLDQKKVKSRWPEVWEDCRKVTRVMSLTVKERKG